MNVQTKESSLITEESLRTANFSPEEFLESATAVKLNLNNKPNLNQLTCGVHLTKKMQQIRDVVKKPIHISSGFRSEEVNKAVKGSRGSKHMQFLACDFLIDGMTPLETVLAVEDSKVSVDKCFVERGCAHVQFCLNDDENKNEFGSAVLVNGKWKVSSEIKQV